MPNVSHLDLGWTSASSFVPSCLDSLWTTSSSNLSVASCFLSSFRVIQFLEKEKVECVFVIGDASALLSEVAEEDDWHPAGNLRTRSSKSGFKDKLQRKNGPINVLEVFATLFRTVNITKRNRGFILYSPLFW